MAVIPRKLYAYIEKKLFEQPYAAVSEAAEALIERKEQAYGVKSPGGEGGSGKSSGVSNRVQDGVLRVIAAEEDLDAANRWALESRGLARSLRARRRRRLRSFSTRKS